MTQQQPALQLSTTAALVNRARAGHTTSKNALVEHCLPRLRRRMASGRVPSALSGVVDAEDIVQETLLRAFRRLDAFQPRCPGAFICYLRSILRNVLADHGRKLKRAPEPGHLEAEPEGPHDSPVEIAVGSELWERYQSAVEKLTQTQHEAVVLFVECGMGFEEIAAAIESVSSDAARMLVARGLKKLAELMRVESN